MTGWSVVQRIVFGRWAREGSPARAAIAGTATSVAADVTDYHLVPERMTPGFEKRLSPSALTIVYAVLAASLAVGIRGGK